MKGLIVPWWLHSRRILLFIWLLTKDVNQLTQQIEPIKCFYYKLKPQRSLRWKAGLSAPVSNSFLVEVSLFEEKSTKWTRRLWLTVKEKYEQTSDYLLLANRSVQQSCVIMKQSAIKRCSAEIRKEEHQKQLNLSFILSYLDRQYFQWHQVISNLHFNLTFKK